MIINEIDNNEIVWLYLYTLRLKMASLRTMGLDSFELEKLEDRSELVRYLNEKYKSELYVAMTSENLFIMLPDEVWWRIQLTSDGMLIPDLTDYKAKPKEISWGNIDELVKSAIVPLLTHNKAMIDSKKHKSATTTTNRPSDYSNLLTKDTKYNNWNR